jgi:hypothetical protein
MANLSDSLYNVHIKLRPGFAPWGLSPFICFSFPKVYGNLRNIAVYSGSMKGRRSSGGVGSAPVRTRELTELDFAKSKSQTGAEGRTPVRTSDKRR